MNIPKAVNYAITHCSGDYGRVWCRRHMENALRYESPLKDQYVGEGISRLAFYQRNQKLFWALIKESKKNIDKFIVSVLLSLS